MQAIFGAFLVGLIIPREGGLCIALTEKLEDMVQVIFLPLVSNASPLSPEHTPDGGIVLHAVGSEHQSYSAQRRCVMAREIVRCTDSV